MLTPLILWAATAQVEYLRPATPVAEPTAARVEVLRLEQADPADEILLLDAAYAATVATASLLTRNTTYEVRAIPLDSARLDRVEASVEAFYGNYPAAADAVVTLRSVLPGGEVFSAARRNRIRTIEIDAATPLSGDGVGIARSEDGALPWLSLSNLSRMLEIVAADLTAMTPRQGPAIDANLNAGKQDLFAMRQDIARRGASLENPFVLTLSPHANALLQECGFFVAGALPALSSDSGEDEWEAVRLMVKQQVPAFVVADPFLPLETEQALERRLEVCVKRLPLLTASGVTEEHDAWPTFLAELRAAVALLFEPCQP